ncbi:MAG: hypothetical protein HQK52_07880 [Oligoflexia bacterium]|nr:hypothetical protein [Oligoflexia bacterium]
MMVISLFMVHLFASSVLVSAQEQTGTTTGASGAAGGMDPRVKIILTMSGYGAVGGALIGAATMAYGTGFRAVAVGASLGLYAGLAFAGYVLTSHYYNKQASTGGPVSVSNPYQDMVPERSRVDLYFDRHENPIGGVRPPRAFFGMPKVRTPISFQIDLLRYEF